ncbi:MAG: dephospho-CoA kinase [Phycisphaerales bacterium JB059]
MGSGKSSVARHLAALGALVSDSDAQIREALTTDDVRDELRRWWGEGILDDRGRVDRSAVARIVFRDDDERARLEALLHPYALRAREQIIKQGERERAPCVVIDAPLLFEAGLDAGCDAIIFVETPREIRMKRLRVPRGWDEHELDRREKAQLPLEQKRARSEYTVVNDGDEAALQEQVRRTLALIREAFLSRP